MLKELDDTIPDPTKAQTSYNMKQIAKTEKLETCQQSRHALWH